MVMPCEGTISDFSKVPDKTKSFQEVPTAKNFALDFELPSSGEGINQSLVNAECTSMPYCENPLAPHSA